MAATFNGNNSSVYYIMGILYPRDYGSQPNGPGRYAPLGMVQSAFADECADNRCGCAGTHDNSTTAGWYQDDASEGDKAMLKEYAGFDGNDLAWFMITMAMRSVANTSIFLMQVRCTRRHLPKNSIDPPHHIPVLTHN